MADGGAFLVLQDPTSRHPARLHQHSDDDQTGGIGRLFKPIT